MVISSNTGRTASSLDWTPDLVNHTMASLQGSSYQYFDLTNPKAKPIALPPGMEWVLNGYWMAKYIED